MNKYLFNYLDVKPLYFKEVSRLSKKFLQRLISILNNFLPMILIILGIEFLGLVARFGAVTMSRTQCNPRNVN